MKYGFTFPVYGHYVRIIRGWKNSQNMAVNMEKAFILTLFYLPDLHFIPAHSDMVLHIKI